MSKDMFDLRRQSFEEEYFRKKDAQLVDKLKSVFNRELSREEIRKRTKIKDEVLLDRLVALNVSGETITAFRLYPLVEIAWADGKLDEREAEVLLKSATEIGISPTSEAYKILQHNLRQGPRAEAHKVWMQFAAELRNTLTAKELATFRNDLLEMGRRVAEASGGILNMAFRTSSGEHRILKEIEDALTV